MVGPITNQVPLVGPMRPDAGLKVQEERRIQDEQSKLVAPPRDESGAGQKSDEILTAEGEIAEMAHGVMSTNGRLSIDQDKDSGDYIYRLVDKETGEVINQWPREDILRRARVAREQYEGLVVDRQV